MQQDGSPIPLNYLLQDGSTNILQSFPVPSLSVSLKKNIVKTLKWYLPNSDSIERKLSQDKKKLEATRTNNFKTENRTRTDKNYSNFRNISDNLMMYQEEIIPSMDNKKIKKKMKKNV